MQRKALIDRARDLFLYDKSMTSDRALFLLEAEYPEFTSDQCQEAISLYLKVKAMFESKVSS